MEGRQAPVHPTGPASAELGAGAKGNMGRILSFGFAGAVGAVLGLVAGHQFVQAGPIDPLSFWLEHPIILGHWKWALGGLLTGLAARYFLKSE